jgi:phosphoribosylglycinamide formyltransferase-1
LLSGRGSNLHALVRATQTGTAGFELVGAFSDRAQAPGLEIARAAGIPAAAFEPAAYADKARFEAALFAAIAASGADLIVLAGYMRLLTDATVAAWQGRMINIHPSLLPAYPGLHTHARALADGVSEHGASVHYVSPVLDGGPVIAQVRVPVLPGDDPDALAARLLPQEHRLLVACVELIARGRVRLVGDSVQLDGEAMAAPLQVAADR